MKEYTNERARKSKDLLFTALGNKRSERRLAQEEERKELKRRVTAANLALKKTKENANAEEALEIGQELKKAMLTKKTKEISIERQKAALLSETF